MADFTKKYEKPIKGELKRTEQVKVRLSKDEIDLWDVMVNCMADRRNTAPNRPGLLVYLLERAYEREQEIEIFHDDKYRNNGKKKIDQAGDSPEV